jgi:hypothetical protein
MSVITEISLSQKVRNLIKANFNEIEDLDINTKTKEIVFHNPIEKSLKKAVKKKFHKYAIFYLKILGNI